MRICYSNKPKSLVGESFSGDVQSCGLTSNRPQVDPRASIAADFHFERLDGRTNLKHIQVKPRAVYEINIRKLDDQYASMT